MARNFAEADFILWVSRKIIGGRNPDGTQQGFEISDSDWTNTVLPAINGTFHVAGVAVSYTHLTLPTIYSV